jgi:hypothetical protein
LAAAGNGDITAVDVDELRGALLKAGAILTA